MAVRYQQADIIRQANSHSFETFVQAQFTKVPLFKLTSICVKFP